MRKLILITVIALTSTTSCYANLSLADASPAAPIEQPKAQPPEHHASETRSENVSHPHRRHASIERSIISTWSHHCW